MIQKDILIQAQYLCPNKFYWSLSVLLKSMMVWVDQLDEWTIHLSLRTISHFTLFYLLFLTEKQKKKFTTANELPHGAYWMNKIQGWLFLSSLSHIIETMMLDECWIQFLFSSLILFGCCCTQFFVTHHHCMYVL